MDITDDPMRCTLNAINSFMTSDAALPLRPLAERIGATWLPLPAEASIEDEAWGYAWSSIGSEEASGIVVGFDFASYSDESRGEEPLRAEMYAYLRLRPGQRWAAAVERVYEALNQVFGAVRKSYPNSSPNPNNIPVVYDGATKDELDDRAIYISWVAGDPVGIGEMCSQASSALSQLNKSVDRFVSVVDVALGAIYGEVPALSKDAITGWCGEVAALHHIESTEFSPSWYSPYDLRTAHGQTIEVKSTRQKSGGTCHFSPQETAFALTAADGSHRLVCARIPPADVSGLYDVLKQHAKATNLVAEWEPDAPTARLIESTGISKGTACAAQVVITATVSKLKKGASKFVIVDIDCPIPSLVCHKAIAAGVGVTIPMDYVCGLTTPIKPSLAAI